MRIPFRTTPAFLSLLVVSLFAFARPVFALPGEAAAVIAHCGQPDADTRSTSEVDGLPMRTLTYGKMRINFQTAVEQPDAWSFTTGWNNHIPMTAKEVGNKMPCFSAALNEADAVASQSLSGDPSIASQEEGVAHPHPMFGIPNLWVILLLAGIILVFVFAIPRRRRRVVMGPNPIQRQYRKPILQRFRYRSARKIVPERP